MLEEETGEMDKAELAVAKHKKGFNCCQAVVCSFAEEVGVGESLLYKMSEGFGGGMGTEKGVCGAMCGAAILSGLVHSDGNTEAAGQTKAVSTKAAGTMQEKFIEKAGRLICGEIKHGNNGEAVTLCDDCIRIAARLAQEELGL